MTPTKESPIMMKHYLKDEAVTALDGTTHIVPAGSTVRVYIEQPKDSPTQPQWTWPEDGLPPVGIECEFYNGNPEAWDHCTVVAHHDGGAVAAVHEDKLSYSYHWGAGSDFRPLRTQAEIERDKLAAEAVNEHAPKGSYKEHSMMAEFARNLYDAGMLRKPISREEAYDKIKDAQSGIQIWERKFPITNHAAHRILDLLGYKD